MRTRIQEGRCGDVVIRIPVEESDLVAATVAVLWMRLRVRMSRRANKGTAGSAQALMHLEDTIGYCPDGAGMEILSDNSKVVQEWNLAVGWAKIGLQGLKVPLWDGWVRIFEMIANRRINVVVAK
jgi:hypothetical protein